MRVRSSSSRRSVPIQRSANAFADRCPDRCGEGLDVFGVEDLVEGVDELVAAVAHEGPCAGELVAVAKEEVAGCLGGPGAGRVFGDPAEVHGAGGDVDEEEQVVAAQRDGVDGGEVACNGGLGAQELGPGHRRAFGCGVNSGVLEDLPDGGGCDGVAQATEFALDPAVAPRRVLVGETKKQPAELGRGRGSTRWATGLGPVPGDASAVPAEQGVGGVEPALA